MIEVTFEDNFEFEKTYEEYGFDVRNNELTDIPNYLNNIVRTFMGVTQLHFLHNCLIVHTRHLGNDIEGLTDIKEKMGAMRINVALFSPYIKGNENEKGLFYNLYYAENCTPPKYPKQK